MSQNVIELNGKRYDAITGKLLGVSTAKAVAHVAAKHAGTPAPGRVVDGFFRAPHPAAKGKSLSAATKPKQSAPHAHQLHAKPAAPKPQPAAAAHLPAPAQLKAATPAPKVVPTAAQHHAGHAHMHAPAKPVERHQPQHSKTLMRAAVQKPEMRLKPAIKPQSPAELAARPAASLLRKPSVASVDPARLERAKTTAKHGSIARFKVASYGMAPVRSTVESVAKGPVPVIPVRSHPVAAPAPVPAKHTDIFEAAIKHAHSHEQPLHHPHQRRRRRFLHMGAGAAAILIVLGFVTYLNLPNIQLHIASVDAGFHASMPSYRPTGYALQGGVQHVGGTVTMRFTSGDSSYQITQQSSNWDSQALLDNTLALSGPHQTIERAGRTIYVYGDGANASWVTGNIRYDITGNASLEPDQLADIAASM